MYFFWQHHEYRQEREFTFVVYTDIFPLTWESLTAYLCGAIGNKDNFDFPWSRERGKAHYQWLSLGIKRKEDPWTDRPAWDWPLREPPKNKLPSTLAQYPDTELDDIAF